MANDYMAKLAADLDGMTMGGLASKGRYGDTMIAHINPQEAQMLIEEGGSGTINPMTGLPEFYDGDEAGFGDGGYAGSGDFGDDDFGESTADIGGGGDTGSSDTGGGAMDAVDADAYVQAAIEDPDIPLSAIGSADDIADFYGFGSPTAGVAGAQKGFTGLGEVGLGPLTPSEEQAKQDAAKGIYQKELWPVLDAKGYEYVNKALNVPGFFTNAVNAYNEGYEGGGPGGTADFFFDDIYEDIGATIASAKADIKKQDKEDEEPFDEPGEFTEAPTDYFGDLLSGFTDFFTGSSQDEINLMSEAAKQSGYNFTPMSDAEKYAGSAISLLGPGPIGFAKGLADAIAFATGTRVIGTIDTPMGPLQVTEKGTVQSPDLPDAPDAGNEPTITKKRKVATEKTDDDEEDKKEEVDKPYFPRNPLPFTPSEEQTLTNIFGPDSYLLNQTGLRTLV